MAPNFRKNMFYCSQKDNKVTGLVGFKDKNIFEFRDKLIKNICDSNKDLWVHKDEGEPTKFDSLILFFDKIRQVDATSFFEKKAPNTLQTIFYTKSYRNWRDELHALRKSATIALETSHDFPCLVITSTLYSPTQLKDIINNIAQELSLEIYENKELEDTKILMSNRTFDMTKK